ncbi:ABC transporter substrate-binding protein [uncultured Kiloniella sp.]|uniref:ABC transporter substrate-binding protein n=1 Tax=uncultured Kiloniella sp. TaxID=1133091 RepID=UPI00261ECD28|nr:ABC transporter substrate-binding protein [uncultured Kiloniella sp.]
MLFNPKNECDEKRQKSCPNHRYFQDRRTLLKMGATASTVPFLSIFPSVQASQGKNPPRRIVCLDYGSATTLLELGIPPVGVVAAQHWDYWVGAPKLPSSVADIGQDLVINLEAISRLNPDLILMTPYTASHKPVLEKIAPIEMIPLFDGKRQPLQASREITENLGVLLGIEKEAEAYLKAFNVQLAKARDLVAKRNYPPLTLLNFMDGRHARVYGENSLYQNVMDEVGLTNAWTEETNYWGFQTIGLERLALTATKEMELVVFEPLMDDIKPTLENSPLWKHLPAVKNDRFALMPPVLMFGMLPSAKRFLSLILSYLESRYS